MHKLLKIEPLISVSTISTTNTKKNHAIHAFETMKQHLELFDSFRNINPLKRVYTWETLNPSIIKERIDILYVSNSLQDFVT